MPVGVLGALGGLVGGIAQAGAAKSAAKAQSRAADQQLELQREIYGDQTRRVEPFLGAGTNALSAYQFELGLGERPMIGATPLEVTEIAGQAQPVPTGATFFQGDRGRPSGYYQNGRLVQQGGQAMEAGPMRFGAGDRTFDTREEAEAFARANPTGGTPYRGFQATPGYQFALDQGRAQVDASAAARGGLNSGRTLQDLTRFGQGMQNQEYGNYLNRLAGGADMGLGAATLQANAGNAFAGMASTALANRGDARAAGAIGFGNAINSGIGNALGSFSYMQNLNRPQQSAPKWWLGQS
jgi:hypothetical protein